MAYRSASRHLTAFLGRFRQTGVLSPAPKPSKTRKLDPYCDFIDELYMNDDELSAKDVQKLLRDLHMVDVSISTIKRQRACLGWRFSKPSNAQMVRNVNQEKRLLSCQSLMEEGHVVDPFNNVIFTDETTVQLHQNWTISFCKIGEQHAAIQDTSQTPIKTTCLGRDLTERSHRFPGLHGKYGRGVLLHRDHTILVETLQPFIAGTYPAGHCFVLFIFVSKLGDRYTRRMAWEELAGQLSALGCPGRNAAILGQSWSDLKKRANQYVQKRTKTGRPS